LNQKNAKREPKFSKKNASVHEVKVEKKTAVGLEGVQKRTLVRRRPVKSGKERGMKGNQGAEGV